MRSGLAFLQYDDTFTMTKKKNSRSRSTLSDFRRMLAESFRSLPVGVVDPFEAPVEIAVPQASRSSSSQSSTSRRSRLLLEWENALEDFLECCTYHPGFLSPTRLRMVTIEQVFENRIVTGVFRDANVEHHMVVRLENDDRPYQCSCSLPNQHVACGHIELLVQLVLTQLKNPSSEAYQKINLKRFDHGPIDERQFQFDNGKLLLNQLDGLIRATSGKPLMVSLPDLKVSEPQQRIGWNINLQGGFNVELVSQPPKKKGDGWNRGRKIPMTRLWDESLLMNENDRSIRRMVSFREGAVSLPNIRVLQKLIGASNVQLMGSPATVEASNGTFELTTSPTDGRVKARLKEELAWPDCQSFHGDDGAAFLSRSLSRIAVYPCSNEESRLIRELRSLDEVHESHRVALIERLRRLQHCVNIELPSDVAGMTVPEPVSLVMLLRSSSDGRLAYGLRVRDSEESLHRPGQGRMTRAITRDGKPVQLTRSATDEWRMVDEWCAASGNESLSTEGTTNTFEETMALLSSLRQDEGSIEVLWDPATESQPKYVGQISTGNVRISIEKKRDWFQLSGVCSLGDESLELKGLMQALEQSRAGGVGSGYIRVGADGWATISADLAKRLEQLNDAVHTERGTMKFDGTSAHAMRSIQSMLHVDAPALWQKMLDRLQRAETLEPDLPVGLNATLRDYQFEGFRWMRRLAEWGVGGVLADDMGLGKTIQTLAVMLDRAGQGPSLVVAPTSVGFNWMREIARFAPELEAHLYRETDRGDFLNQLGPKHVVVCSYGLALRDAAKLKKVVWNTLVLDEAQAIKNARSKTALAIAEIESEWTVALTGTPVENHLGELWSLFRVVAPGVLGGWEQFRNRFAGPIERDNDPERSLALRDRLKPFVLRRTKLEVLKDLPSRTEMNLLVELSPAERALYDSVRLSVVEEVDSLVNLPDVQDQRFRILALLTRLRQLACHPRLVDSAWSERSAKLIQLKETVLELKQEGHRVLIFSQFVQHLQLIREMLEEEGISYQYLDGSTPAAKRQQEVDQFQNGDATAFLISLKAGGTGLNLTAADYVIHMDPWWNPAVEDQATDRAHRIGQTKPVMVYRIIAQGTIEDEILKLHETKRDLIAGVLEGAQAAAKLSTQDLIAMIKQGR